jgi:hypothetical protein
MLRIFLRQYRKVSILGVWKCRAVEAISEFWDGTGKGEARGVTS